MSAEQPQEPLSWIPEILEQIFLQTDMRTLLTSVQRVCRQWLTIIKSSDRIQEHLFFKPAPKKQMSKRKRNSLLSDTFWPEFLRKQLNTPGRHQSYQQLQFPMIDRMKEPAFLREEASWRQMLFQQPPTSCLGIIETILYSDSPWFSRIKVMPRKDYIRVKDVYKAVHDGILMPGQDEWLFWYNPYFLHRSERELQGERAIASSNYLEGCDLVIFTTKCWILRDRDIKNDLDDWIDSLGKFKRDRSCQRLHVWNNQAPFSGLKSTINSYCHSSEPSISTALPALW